MLSAPAIYADLRCLDIPVLSETEVISPRAESIREVYAALIEVCLKKPRFEILKPKLDQLKILRQPELHDRTTELLSLFNNVRRLLDRIGCLGEFKLNDFFKPDFKRHRRFLSAVLNFVKFRTQEEELVNAEENHRETAERIRAEYQGVRAAYDRAQNDLEAVKLKQLEMVPLVDEKKAKVAELTSRITAINAERNKLETEAESLQESIEDVAEMAAQVRAVKEELDRLTGAVKRVMPNSEKAIIPLEQLRELLECDKTREDLRAEYGSKKRLLEEVKVKLIHAKLMLESYAASVRKTSTLKLEIEGLQAKLAGLELEASGKKCNANGPDANQRSQELTQLEVEAAELQMKLVKAHEERDGLKTELRAGEELLQSLRAEKLKTETDMKETQQKYIENYRLLIAKVSAYRAYVTKLVASEGCIPAPPMV